MAGRVRTWAAVVVVGTGVLALAIGAIAGGQGAAPWWQVAGACVVALPGVSLGLLLLARRQGVVGLLLVALGTLSLLLLVPGRNPAADPSQGSFAHGMAVVGAGAWIWLYVPPAVLAAVFPDGRLPSRRWRWLLAGWVVFVVVFHVAVALDPGTYGDGEGQVPGHPPITVSAGLLAAVGFGSLGLLLTLLVSSVAAVVLRYRHGSDLVKRQIRWFVSSISLLPMVLVAAWLSRLLGDTSGTVVVVGLLMVFAALPVTVAIGVLRHDLYDIDRLLSRAVTYTIVSGVLSATFAVVVVGTGLLVGRGSRVAVALGTVACAIAFSPMRRRVQQVVDKRFDRDRREALDQLTAFVDAVRDGTAQPEDVDAVLRAALRDPALTVVYAAGGDQGSSWHDGHGRPATRPPEPHLDISAGGRLLGCVGYGAAAARPQMLRDALREAHLPLEVARYRIALMHALAETEASRARMLTATDAERRRLERDLHDGAQQRLVAIGMSLRLAQGRIPAEQPVHAVLGSAVNDLRDAIAELRHLAGGVRPSGLDEGLAAAVRTLVRTSPVPVDVRVTTAQLPDAIATTAYYVVAEAVANALKHASPERVRIDVTSVDDMVHVVVVDDGRGGAVVVPGAGLGGLSDRVSAGGGTLRVSTEAGQGTRVEARLPCGS